MAQSVLRPPTAFSHPQSRLVRRALIAALTALAALIALGAQNQITLSVVPLAAGAVGLSLDEYNLHRLAMGRSALWHGWCAAILGSAVLVVALVVFSAT